MGKAVVVVIGKDDQVSTLDPLHIVSLEQRLAQTQAGPEAPQGRHPKIAAYRTRFGWRENIPIDRHEKRFLPQRPLLPFVESLNERLPKKWESKPDRFVPDDEWLLRDFHALKIQGKHVESVRR